MNPNTNSAYLVFGGHNNRAAITLCRYFTAKNIDFYIVNSCDDSFFETTSYREKIAFRRQDKQLNKQLFDDIAQKTHRSLIYCPTTEYINQYLIHNKVNEALFVSLPPAPIYEKLTSKKNSQDFLEHNTAIKIPKLFETQNAAAPCVFKPINNIHNGRTLYPVICLTQKDIENFKSREDQSLFFAQEYIDGKSYYLCGYLSQTGRYEFYWQENLLQQNHGKSIVLAKSSGNPGINESDFFLSLYKIGYFGPIMMEIMVMKNAAYYIEINPRFWGPLQLAIDTNPKVLDLFALEHGKPVSSLYENPKKDVHYYSWLEGASATPLRSFFDGDDDIKRRLIIENDIFSPEKYSDMVKK